MEKLREARKLNPDIRYGARRVNGKRVGFIWRSVDMPPGVTRLQRLAETVRSLPDGSAAVFSFPSQANAKWCLREFYKLKDLGINVHSSIRRNGVGYDLYIWR